MAKFIDISNQKYGRLCAIRRVDNNKHNQVCWLCRCECGNEIIVTTIDLRRGHTKSCGCLRKEIVGATHRTHGKRHTRLHSIWATMKERCDLKKRRDYKYYGGRGITVCDEWRNDFQAFYDWAMANGYLDDLTIDRIDVNGNYEPSNCRWITIQEQQKNKRNTSAGNLPTDEETREIDGLQAVEGV